jgi:DNA polymerase-3 subunit gamma/tau
VIRLSHVADLPSPEDLVRRLTDAPAPPATPAPAGGGSPRGGGVRARAQAAPAPAPAPETSAETVTETTALARYAQFEDVLALVRARRDMPLLVEIETGLRLVKYAPGRIEFEPAAQAAPELAARLGERLRSWTGTRWGVSVVGSVGGASIAEERAALRDDLQAQARTHPLVQAMLIAFPDAELHTPVLPPGGPGDAGAASAPTDDDDWDPFDPFSEED